MARVSPGSTGLRIAMVGATGLVGRELLSLLESSRFPIAELLCFSSGRAKKRVLFRGRRLPAPRTDPRALEACDLAFLVSADEVARSLAPGLAARGVYVIDDSAAFRLSDGVPLVIPEVNASALRRDRRLIAGPNCTMAPIAVAGNRLRRLFGMREVRAASYQAVSGAGIAALKEFFAQGRALSRWLSLKEGRAVAPPSLKSSALPRPIAFNVFPQVGRFNEGGESSEEWKVGGELRKVWSAPALPVSVTAVRVPVVRGHSLAVWFTLARPASLAQARRALEETPGLRFSAEPAAYPTPLDCAGRAPVYAGRLRAGAGPREFCLWLVSDNLLKGAALNSLQIAEELLRRGWLRRRLARSD